RAPRLTSSPRENNMAKQTDAVADKPSTKPARGRAAKESTQEGARQESTPRAEAAQQPQKNEGGEARPQSGSAAPSQDRPRPSGNGGQQQFPGGGKRRKRKKRKGGAPGGPS